MLVFLLLFVFVFLFFAITATKLVFSFESLVDIKVLGPFVVTNELRIGGDRISLLDENLFEMLLDKHTVLYALMGGA